jgi:hypothetical protein
VILQGEARVINSYTSEIIPPGVEQTSRCSWESKEKKKNLRHLGLYIISSIYIALMLSEGLAIILINILDTIAPKELV